LNNSAKTAPLFSF